MLVTRALNCRMLGTKKLNTYFKNPKVLSVKPDEEPGTVPSRRTHALLDYNRAHLEATATAAAPCCGRWCPGRPWRRDSVSHRCLQIGGRCVLDAAAAAAAGVLDAAAAAAAGLLPPGPSSSSPARR